jgi:hypothetical protein
MAMALGLRDGWPPIRGVDVVLASALLYSLSARQQNSETPNHIRKGPGHEKD